MADLLAASAVIATLLAAGPVILQAKDHGQAGQAFPITEPDLLATIETRLNNAKASGALDRANAAFAQRVAARVNRPEPVAAITPTRMPRAWDFDPSIRLERDIRDAKGNLVAAAGQEINPLDFVAIRLDLVFVDGDDGRQLAWATKHYADLKAKIIFVGGSPIDRMTELKRRFYFDQAGKLTARFGIEHVPAVVTQAGRVMRVSEVALGPGA